MCINKIKRKQWLMSESLYKLQPFDKLIACGGEFCGEFTITQINTIIIQTIAQFQYHLF